MQLFIRAKHWQLFIVLLGAMVLPSWLMFHAPWLYSVGMAMFSALYFGWLWSIGSACNRLVPIHLRRSSCPMAVGLVYAAVYTVTFSLWMAYMMEWGPIDPSAILPFHVLAMAGIFYSLIYSAKRLVTLQRGEAVGFFDYGGAFFMLWFFPLGVWFIQPKVNALLAQPHS